MKRHCQIAHEGGRRAIAMVTMLRSFLFGITFLFAMAIGGAAYAADIYGWLFSQDGQPMPNQTMQLNCAGQVHSGRTDGQGFFQFNNVPTGTCQLVHAETGTERGIYVDPGRSRHDLTL